MPAGYSGTRTGKKLTLKEGMRVWFDGMPESIATDIAQSVPNLTKLAHPEDGLAAAHIFVTEKADLLAKLRQLRKLIAKDGQVWVSWPKKASGMPTEVDQAIVQQAGLDAGFVDTKKCAVDETWSGMKFVIRKADR